MMTGIKGGVKRLMNDPLLDRIEAVTGRLTNRRLMQLDNISERTIKGWRKELRSLCGKLDFTAMQGRNTGLRDEMRPYFRYIPGFVRQIRNGPASPSAAQEVIENIMRQLLYCHSVVIDDPLTNLVDENPGPGVLEFRKSREIPEGPTFDKIRIALQFLALARPLIKAGLIVLLPSVLAGQDEWWYGNNGRAPEWFTDIVGDAGPDADYWYGYGNVPATCYVGNLLTDEMKEIVRATPMERERAPVVQAVEAFLPDVYRFLVTQGGIDFNLNAMGPGMYRAALAETLAQEAGIRRFQQAGRSLDDSRVIALISVDAPAFNTLSFKDLVRLHSDSDAFLNWRIALGHALDFVLAESGPEARLESETQQRFFEALYPALSAIKAEAPSLKSMSLSGLQSLVVGSIPVAIGMITKSEEAGFAAAGTSSAVTFAWTYGTSLRRRRVGSTANMLTKELHPPK